MKAKFYLIAAAACAALAACSKNEVAPVDVDQEITFQAVVNKASTKATEIISSTTYPTNIPFGSYAYFYPSSFGGSDTKLYINNAEVKNNSGATSGAVWTTDPAYYWPKNGKLTFYSYSPYEVLNTEVSCSYKNGLKITNHNVDANQTVDVMVADRIDNQTSNGSNAGYTGVPTVFRHKLAQVVNFRIKTSEDYSTGSIESPQIGDKFFFLNEIQINKIAYKGSFKSGENPSESNKGSWTKGVGTKDYTWYTSSSTTEKEFSSDFVDSPKNSSLNGYLLVLPQEMTAMSATQTAKDVEHIVLKYTIRTFWGTGASEYSDEAVVQTVDLKTITDSWVINKKYTYDITVSLDKIYWAPSVINWEPETDVINF